VRVGDQPCDEAATAELVRRALADDPSAWEALLDRFWPKVRAIVWAYGLSQYDAQDAAQTVWCRLADHLDRVRAPESVGAWLAATTHNECRRQVRLARRTAPRDPALLDGADHRTPESWQLAADTAGRVRRAVALLREPDRTVALLVLNAPRIPTWEVAEFTGLHPSEVPAVRRRVRRRLRRLYNDEIRYAGPTAEVRQ
jgi:RNA polymerase sigma factor (sigma-70 family)